MYFVYKFVCCCCYIVYLLYSVTCWTAMALFVSLQGISQNNNKTNKQQLVMNSFITVFKSGARGKQCMFTLFYYKWFCLLHKTVLLTHLWVGKNMDKTLISGTDPINTQWH